MISFFFCIPTAAGSAYWFFGWFGVAAWLAGMCVSMGVEAAIGRRLETTYGDCFSGDYDLDMCIAAWWPVFWPCAALFWLPRIIIR